MTASEHNGQARGSTKESSSQTHFGLKLNKISDSLMVGAGLAAGSLARGLASVLDLWMQEDRTRRVFPESMPNVSESTVL
jgi:hypothetical protein